MPPFTIGKEAVMGRLAILSLVVLLFSACIGLPHAENESDTLVIGSFIIDFPDGFLMEQPKTIDSRITLTVKNLTKEKSFTILTHEAGYFWFLCNGKDSYELEKFSWEDTTYSGHKFTLESKINYSFKTVPQHVLYLGHYALHYRQPEKQNPSANGTGQRNFKTSMDLDFNMLGTMENLKKHDADAFWRSRDILTPTELTLPEEGGLKLDTNKALIKAAENGKTGYVRALLKAGADVDVKDLNGNTALIYAALNRSPETVEILLNAGADPNAKNKHGWTALMCASGRRHVGIVQALLAAGAEVNVDDGAALIWAVLGGDVKTVRVLVDAGIHVNPKDDLMGITALMIAAGHDYRRNPEGRVERWGGNIDIVQILLDAGADIDIKDWQGKTALMWAAREEGHNEIVHILLRAGADANAKDQNGRTALMLASGNGNIQTVRLLLDAEADINTRDINNRSAIMYAKDGGHSELFEILNKAGAKE
jgi:ankyrin repeat protein